MPSPDHKPSGWYPDESNSSQERWWNGISWGDQTRPANGAKQPLIVPMSTPTPVDPYASSSRSAPTPPRSAAGATSRGEFRRVNQIGYSGTVLAFISILFNIFCIPSILAIVFTAIGLNNERKRRGTGRRAVGLVWCIVGLVLGLVETSAYLANFVK